MDYSYIIIPIIVVIASQAIKLLTDGVKGNFDLKALLTFYGGMPSSHTAFAVSALTVVGFLDGVDSPLFGVTLVFSILVMRDAIAFRNILGTQSKLFNRIRETLPENNKQDLPVLREQLGHSTLEVAGGAAFGFLLSWFLLLV